jgi:signal transduction histidine kinase
MHRPSLLQDGEIATLVERMGVEPQRTRGVLLVDDERLNLTVLRDVLEEHYTVHTAESGDEALRLAEQVPLDVVVTDQRMPGMSGVDLLAELRQRHPDLAGIVLTAYTDTQALEAAINRANVFRFIRKPWEAVEILHEVDLAGRQVGQRRTVERLVSLLAARTEALDASLLQLKTQQEALLNLERLGTIGRLSAGLMHDLKNIIVALRAAEWEMARTTTAAPLQEIMTLGMAGVDNLLRTLQTLQEYSRTGTLELQLQHVEPATVVQDTLALSRMDLNYRLRRVTSDVPPLLPSLRADRQKLTQVFVNLMRNALHATESGAGVRMAVEARGDSVEFSVEDEGPGVPPALQERIFEPFVSSKGAQGLGLGLYMARLIVESHRGHISVRNRPEGGARFEVVLPVERA